MKTKLLSIVLLSVSFFYSCNNELEINDKQVSEQIELTADEITALSVKPSDVLISEEEALEEAKELLASLDKNSLKSGTTRSLKSSEIHYYSGSSVLKSSNKSLDDSIAIYLFNFSANGQEEGGFALVSGDKRLPVVFGCSNEGELDADFDNPGLLVSLSSLPDYLDERLSIFDKRDSLVNSAKSKLLKSGATLKSTTADEIEYVYENQYYYNWYNDNYIEEMLPVHWGQGSPYNNNLALVDCNGTPSSPPAGCVATATAQIMAFHKYPSTINGVYYPWYTMSSTEKASDLSSYYQGKVATLFDEIGQGVNMNYSCSGSGAQTSAANSWLRSVGYATDDETSYNFDAVKSSILANRPVFVSGYAIRNYILWIFPVYYEGHAWVVDGYIQRKQYVVADLVGYQNGVEVSRVRTTYQNSEDYVRCNFGWDGGADGYYASGLFSTNTGATNVGLKSGVSGFYQYNKKIITNIRPN